MTREEKMNMPTADVLRRFPMLVDIIENMEFVPVVLKVARLQPLTLDEQIETIREAITATYYVTHYPADKRAADQTRLPEFRTYLAGRLGLDETPSTKEPNNE